MEHFLRVHHLAIGILADGLTFCGALLLGRDALLHVNDMQARKIHEEFEREFAGIDSTDLEEEAAQSANRVALRGLVILIFGFIFQILGRFGE